MNKNAVTDYQQQLLQQLADQIVRLSEQLKGQKMAPNQEYFDQQLFICHPPHTTYSDYLQEIQRNFKALTLAVQDNYTEKTLYLTDVIVNQLTALGREAATKQLRKQNNPPEHRQESLYDKQARYLTYLHRLEDQQFELEQQLNAPGQTNLALQQKIAALAGRIARCQHAIKQVELQLESAPPETDNLSR